MARLAERRFDTGVKYTDFAVAVEGGKIVAQRNPDPLWLGAMIVNRSNPPVGQGDWATDLARQVRRFSAELAAEWIE